MNLRQPAPEALSEQLCLTRSPVRRSKHRVTRGPSERVMTINFIRSMMTVAAVAVICPSSAFAQNTTPQAMPYTTVDHPQFVSASQTTFLSKGDILIGISNGDVA